VNAISSVWILGDQLLLDHPALAAAEAAVGRAQVCVVLIESAGRIAQHPYQRKKIVLLLAAMRHYAEALRGRGYTVDYRQAPDFLSGLQQHCAAHCPARLFCMDAAEYETRALQQALGLHLDRPVETLPNTQFLVGRFDPYPNPQPGRRYVLEQFYRVLRRTFNVLMDGDLPAGGQWNYDTLNRKPLPRTLNPPESVRFPPDAVTGAVIEQVEASGHGVGRAADFDLAVTHVQAAAALDEFIEQRLGYFGAYEDAMSSRSHMLYHSGLAPYLNIGLLEPLQLIRAAEAAYRAGRAPLNSAEGFIRQVLGWREFIYWQYWRQMPALRDVNAWQAQRDLPAMFWDGVTSMRCLQHTVNRALEHGYTHHIERLMLICNFGMLAGIRPQALNDWFLAAYVDAYEWVMLPNVLGMGLNADGGRTATKPYIASANYIKNMSDYCDGCRYNAKERIGPDACPFNVLYWNFLIRHEAQLRANPRMGPNVLGLNRIAPDERERIQAAAALVLDCLDRDGRL
jgi:deoxyribodipyrimidine photolyase-related protein